MIRALLALLLLAAPAGSVTAGEARMSFYMKNGFSRAVVVELVGPNRVWPGGEKVYLLEAGERKSVPIWCAEGERICWAAWLNGDAGTAWGVGPDADRQCRDCCVVCVASSTATIELLP